MLNDAEIAMGIILGLVIPVNDMAVIINDPKRRVRFFRFGSPLTTGAIVPYGYCLN